MSLYTMQKGYKHTARAKANMSRAALTRNDENRLASIPKGKRHWNWSETPTLLTLHKRIHRRHGAAKKRNCSECKVRQAHDWANVTGKYTDRIEDYLPMCRSCHVRLDKNWMKKRLSK